MKTLFKFRILMVILLAVFFSACKNENNKVDSGSKTDSMDMSVDTVGPAIDSSATLNSGQHGQNGTTGATGEGSTGSGTAGSTQKGNQNIKTDSVKK
ncbi:hypothetical protein [Flavobacterium defluvii]|uniref:Collagen triple helix repeat-containing protein n=1 Tax=Flavobacterium defluvii TaxID=370979 RepID=A0A1M5IXW9_9FLAO|nr:hypothetical protein [Flavobacterium defluvii]SHG32800.1 hypothetical protein SAMN05443663_102535 [Flavobacterium defluvii]